MSAQIEEPFTLEVAYPEFQARFDAHGQGREHDLAIFGKTESGKKIFIGDKMHQKPMTTMHPSIFGRENL